jgi:hypothetical protein
MISTTVMKENQAGVILQHTEIHMGHFVACHLDVFVELLALSNNSGTLNSQIIWQECTHNSAQLVMLE